MLVLADNRCGWLAFSLIRASVALLLSRPVLDEGRIQVPSYVEDPSSVTFSLAGNIWALKLVCVGFSVKDRARVAANAAGTAGGSAGKAGGDCDCEEPLEVLQLFVKESAPGSWHNDSCAPFDVGRVRDQSIPASLADGLAAILTPSLS